MPHKGFRHFAERYLQSLSSLDLDHLTLAGIRGVLEDGWAFLQSWPGDSPKVSIHNLSMLQGNNERGTIIQLLFKNMPFVADSVITEIRRQKYDINFILRGTFDVIRQNGTFQDFNKNSTTPNEMLLHIELRQQVDLSAIEVLEAYLLSIIHDISAAIDDFSPMKEALESTKQALATQEKTSEAGFIDWIVQDHFIFLGVAEIHNGKLTRSMGIFNAPQRYNDLLDQLLATHAHHPGNLWVHKPSFKTHLDRYEPLDVLRIKIQPDKEIVVIGILTYAAQSIPFDQIPYVECKLHELVERFNTYGEYFRPRVIKATANHLPFTEVINLSVDDIVHVCKGALTHQSKYAVFVHHRFDPVLKQLSFMIFLHHDKLNDTHRHAIKALLSKIANAPVLHDESDYIDTDLMCLYVIVPAEKDLKKEEAAALPNKIADVTLSWTEQLRTALINTCGLVEGEVLSPKYANIFENTYRSKYSADTAAEDIIKIEGLLTRNTAVEIKVYGETQHDTEQAFRLKFFKRTEPLALFQLFSMLDSLGLNLISESSFQVRLNSDDICWIHDLVVQSLTMIDLPCVTDPFKQLCKKVLADEVSNDDLNSLVLIEGLTYRQIGLLKAFLSYLKQIQFPFGGKYNRDILLRNSFLTSIVVRLFETKFDPSIDGDQRLEFIQSLNEEFAAALQVLKSEDEDRLFRQLYNLITNILRTNYFVMDQQGTLKPYISMKIDASNILDMPQPAPMAEIFVYSKEFEAVHLRSGKVARGGLRWSDRGEDYRTEVLGLVKAQNTKNAVIVPMGSKGGFYIKKVNPTRDDAIECYQNMIRAMLDITDNIQQGDVVNPPLVVRYDDNDPYLVVAADKGTASFSDIANSISAEYDFWLKDAFASGGSAGYDHKKMAITSRGAWESVKQHCKEVLNIDPEVDTITVVGVGDMSGDVFGNGMLRSKTILLKAAFNHRHIFIDPAPNPAVSFKERERLFKLPHSSWSDYGTTILSKGGMIIERSSKSVQLTPEAKAFLGLTNDTVRPNDVMKAILKADVDLMWFGGIGTYIKASSETNEAVSDRANDTIRVNGEDVRAKIIAEGANLGCTQKGRIEYALTRNGRINTDFIDNSGGVDCSDHEVNIKILLNQVIESSGLTLEARNALLKTMTNAVERAVTAENVLQNLALSYAAHNSVELLDEYEALTRYLNVHAELNSKIEFLPSVAEFNERQKLQQGLTRPELAVLMAYTKNHLKSQLLKSDILDHPCLKLHLEAYFPKELHVYVKYMQQHPLRREIIATKLTSEIVDRLGLHFIHRLLHQTGKSIADILNAYSVVKLFFQLDVVWENFDRLLPKLTYLDRIDFMHSVSETVYNGCAWLLTLPFIQANIQELHNRLEALFNTVQGANLLLSSQISCALPSDKRVNLKPYLYNLQQRLTAVHLLSYDDTFDKEELILFEMIFNRVQTAFNLDYLKQIIKNIPNKHFWGQLFVLSTELELERLHRDLTHSICVSILAKHNTFEAILKTYKDNIAWLSSMIQRMMKNSVYDPSAVTVIMRHVENLTTSIQHSLET